MSKRKTMLQGPGPRNPKPTKYRKPKAKRPTLKDVMKRIDRIEKRLAELRPQTIPVPAPYPEPLRDPTWCVFNRFTRTSDGTGCERQKP